ncbi:MAG: HEAT repeat domain-containing protein [Planctomycetes bacterium]|nr:HEAT repeat domain-containing protein [Planctomycetota bacterium]
MRTESRPLETRRLVRLAAMGFSVLAPLVQAQSDGSFEDAFRKALAVPDSSVRLEALRQLQDLVQTPDSIQETKPLVLDVSGLLSNDRNPIVRREAVRTLVAFQSSEARSALHQALESPDSAVRYEAVTGLGNVGDQSSLPFLQARLDDRAPHVRRAALRAIQAIARDRRRRSQAPALPPPAHHSGAGA